MRNFLFIVIAFFCGCSVFAAPTGVEDCVLDSDCEDRVHCDGGRCIGNCSDGVQQASETDVDCGGICGVCDEGEGCSIDAECESGLCSGEVCVAVCFENCSSCDNQTLDPDETDFDCGGACGPCAEGERCAVDGDCSSELSCILDVCSEPRVGWHFPDATARFPIMVFHPGIVAVDDFAFPIVFALPDDVPLSPDTIAFATQTGDVLPFSVEVLGEPRATVWVELPLLQPGEQTIYMYAGVSSVPVEGFNDYLAMWHLADNTNSVVGEALVGNANLVQSAVGIGRTFTGQSNLCLEALLPTFDVTSGLTVTAIAKWNDLNGEWNAFLSQDHSPSTFYLYLGHSPTHFAAAEFASITDSLTIVADSTVTTEYQTISIVYESTSQNASLFLDGERVGSENLSFVPTTSEQAPLQIGCDAIADVDEVWIESRPRTGEWHAAFYHNTLVTPPTLGEVER